LISGVVLAAGTSSRLGRPKQLLELEGRPLVQHAVDAAADAGLDEVIVVLGHAAERIRAAVRLPNNVRAVLNPDYALGQSTSVASGLKACRPDAEAAAIMVADQPGLGSEVIAEVVRAFVKGEAPVVRATWGGTPGHPVVVARPTWERWLEAGGAAGLAGDRGARDLVASTPGRVDYELGGPPPPDIDTWEAFVALTRRVT